MRAWKHLGVVAVTLSAACGLDSSGELSASVPVTTPDAGTSHDAGHPAVHDAAHVDATKSLPDAAHDVTTLFDAPLDAREDTSPDVHDAPAEAADAPHDAFHPIEAGTPDAVAVDALAGDAAVHEAGADAAKADASHDSAAAPDAPVVTQPPNVCIIEYSCGSAPCNCNQTCEGNTCGGCVGNQTTCNNFLGTCGTSLTSPNSCGSCDNSCGGCSFTQHATCTQSGAVYTCGCADDF